jgi:hypothetical protein
VDIFRKEFKYKLFAVYNVIKIIFM